MRRENGTFTPGHSPGRPRGAKNRLQTTFLHALASDFEQHGMDAIRIYRIEEPSRYVAIVASLMPKDLLIGTAAQELEDDQIDELIFKLRERLVEHRAVPLPTPKTIEAKCG
jgi:hypothetical protein